MKKILHCCWILGLLGMLGCEKVITIDLPEHQPVLVVNSMFSTDSLWQVRVTASQAIDASGQAQPVTNATVVIWENGAPLDTLVHDSADIYRTQRGRKPEAEHTYQIRASAPGFTTVQGTDWAPRLVIPSDLSFRDSVVANPNGQYDGEFSFKFRDWPGQQNYYVLDLYMVYHFVWDNRPIRQVIPVQFTAADPIVETQGYYGQGIWSDETFDGQFHTIKVNFSGHEPGRDTVYARLSSLSEPCYRYVQSMAKYNNASFDLFAEPVRLYSNMTAGMGIFAGRTSYAMMVP